MYKLSVVIPVHNTQQYLKRCIDSIVLGQDYPLEIIVVDNNSDENYETIFNEYDCVKYISLKENMGPGGARNIGLKNLNSEYIAFCDSDDWVDSNFYTDIIEMLDDSGADIGIGGIKRNFPYSSNERIVKCRFDKKYLLNSDMFYRIMTKEYDTGLMIPPSSVNRVYRCSFLAENEIYFQERKYYEDLLFSIKVALSLNKAICVPNTYYHHYKRIGSVTQSFTQQHVDNFKEIFLDIRAYMVNKGVFKKYMLGYYKFCEHFFNLVIRQLFEYENDENVRKQYIKRALDAFNSVIDLDEYMECYTSEDLRKHIQPLIESTIIN